MCGRARCTLRADDIPRACHRADGRIRTVDTDRYRPSYNVAPGSNLPVLRRDDGSDGVGVVVQCMKWGLIPSFTKKTEKPDFYKMFNARCESVSEKASFRRLLPKSRCLVVVEGFYEWKKDGSKKQPYYIHFKDGRPLVFAALYDSWQSSEGETLYSFTILTTSSSSALQWLHDRMPVILGDKGSTDTWLNGSSTSKFDKILKPYENSDLVWYPVTPAMGKTSFDGPECIKEIKLKTEGKNPISNFFLRKESRKQPEPNQEQKNSSDNSVKTNLSEGLKEEPKKEIKEEKESNLGDSSLFDEPLKKNLPKALNEEPTKDIKDEQEENLEEKTSHTEKGNHDLKSNVSLLPNENTAKCQPKRNYEEFLADSKPATGGTGKPGMSPVKKKGNLNDGGDKQPTLFSFFGKR